MSQTVARTFQTERAVIAALLIVTPIAVATRADDPVHLAQATVVLVGTAVLLATGLARVSMRGLPNAPRSPVVQVSLAFALTVLLAVIVADVSALSLAGPYRRYTGGLLYVCGVVVFLATLRSHRLSTVSTVAWAGTVVGAVVGLYGLIQMAGVDPLPWQAIYDGSFATLGNPNFLSGFLAICLPLACWGLLDHERGLVVRMGCVLAALLISAGLFAAGSLQGPIAAAVGLGVLGWAWLRSKDTSAASSGSWALFGLGATAVLGALLVAARAWTPTADFAGRGHLWATGWNMVLDNPVLGVGLGRFGSYYREYRSAENALSLGVRHTADSAHNVTLDLLAGGGLLVGIPYLLFVALTGWALCRCLWRAKGATLLLAGAVGGAWLAYHVQALVSIDIPPLLLFHWVLAGTILVVAAGLPPANGDETKGSRRRRGVRARLSPLASTGIAVCMAVLLMVLALVPLRASLAAGRGMGALGAGVPQYAADAFARASELAPWEPRYMSLQGEALAGLNDPRGALGALEEALARDPRDFESTLAAAQVAEHIGMLDSASHWYDWALTLEPQHPRIKVEAARIAWTRGEVGEARDLLGAALEMDPDDPLARQLDEEWEASS